MIRIYSEAPAIRLRACAGRSGVNIMLCWPNGKTYRWVRNNTPASCSITRVKHLATLSRTYATPSIAGYWSARHRIANAYSNTFAEPIGGQSVWAPSSAAFTITGPRNAPLTFCRLQNLAFLGVVFRETNPAIRIFTNVAREAGAGCGFHTTYCCHQS